jgi:hypothetical protein
MYTPPMEAQPGVHSVDNLAGVDQAARAPLTFGGAIFAVILGNLITGIVIGIVYLILK